MPLPVWTMYSFSRSWALEGREEQSGVEVAVRQQAVCIVVAAPQDPLRLAARLPRIRQPDVRVSRQLRRVDRIELRRAAERRSAQLAPAEHLLLLVQVALVPALDPRPHTPDHQVAAAAHPGRPVLVPDPDVAVHLPCVRGAQVVRAVLEAEQVAAGLVGRRGARRLGEAGLRPSRPCGAEVAGDAGQVADGVERHLRVVGARLDGEVAAAARRLQPVAGKRRKVDQGVRTAAAKAIAAVEQRWPEADGHRQPRRSQPQRLTGVRGSPVP